MNTIKLKHPFIFEEKEITELSAGRMKVKHLKHLPKSFSKLNQRTNLKNFDVSEYVPFMAALFDVSEACIEEIDVQEDFPLLVEAMVSAVGE